ncbi:MAG TPA: RDD family protein [Acidimicrobiales bacterium]
MLVGLAFLMAPLIVLVVAAAIAASNGPRRTGSSAVALAVISTAVWLAYVGLYQHETPCDGRATRCPTVYGYEAPLPDEHAAGILLLLAGFALPALWAGWRRRIPPMTAGAALALGPTSLAWWTAPRGDNDGLWALIFWFLPILGAAAAVVVTVADRVGTARRQSRSRERPQTVASPSDRLAALAIDVVVIGGVLVVPLTTLSHAKLEAFAGVLGIVLAMAYMAIPLAWKGRTLGQSLVGLFVVDSRTSRSVSLTRASVRGLIVVLEVAAVPTLILAIPAFVELMALINSGRTLTDRLLGTAVLSARGAADAVPVTGRESRSRRACHTISGGSVLTSEETPCSDSCDARKAASSPSRRRRWRLGKRWP